MLALPPFQKSIPCIITVSPPLLKKIIRNLRGKELELSAGAARNSLHIFFWFLLVFHSKCPGKNPFSKSLGVVCAT